MAVTQSRRYRFAGETPSPSRIRRKRHRYKAGGSNRHQWKCWKERERRTMKFVFQTFAQTPCPPWGCVHRRGVYLLFGFQALPAIPKELCHDGRLFTIAFSISKMRSSCTMQKLLGMIRKHLKPETGTRLTESLHPKVSRNLKSFEFELLSWTALLNAAQFIFAIKIWIESAQEMPSQCGGTPFANPHCRKRALKKAVTRFHSPFAKFTAIK